MTQKRLRVFAGPNGSGKSTITAIVKKVCDLGIYVNADDIKVCLKKNHIIDFTKYKISVDSKSFQTALKKSSIVKKSENRISCNSFTVKDNVLFIRNESVVEDYFVSFIADFLRNELLASGKKFSFETVMSHQSKIDFMKKAQKAGYKVYLYYVALRDPDLNIMRVSGRVESGGHNVSDDKIRKRYYESLNLLSDAISVADNSYIIDNSVGQPNMFATIINKQATLFVDYYPKWFEEYFISKL